MNKAFLYDSQKKATQIIDKIINCNAVDSKM